MYYGNKESNLTENIKNLYLKYHKEKTYQHVLNVARVAKELALQYHQDVRKCYIAALLHDMSVIVSPDQMYQYAKDLNYQIDPSEEKYHFLLHQRISKEIARTYFQVEDAEILSAIECHTTLKKDAHDIDKIIFLADKLSWDQEGIPPYYQSLKTKTNISLDQGCYWFIQEQLNSHKLLMPHTWLLQAHKDLKSKIMNKKKIAFICIHNSCRSQIAEAFCKYHCGDRYEVYSAGTQKALHINQDAQRLMKKLYGIDMEKCGQYSKLIQEIPQVDMAISMGCDVTCPYIGKEFDDNWHLKDPTGKDDETFIEVIAEIKKNKKIV